MEKDSEAKNKLIMDARREVFMSSMFHIQALLFMGSILSALASCAFPLLVYLYGSRLGIDWINSLPVFLFILAIWCAPTLLLLLGTLAASKLESLIAKRLLTWVMIACGLVGFLSAVQLSSLVSSEY